MISDLAVLYSFAKKLRDNFPKHKIISDSSMCDIDRPTFLINVSPLDSDTYRQYSKELFNVTIEYVEEKNLSQEEKLIKKSQLNKIFGMGIQIEKTFVVFSKKTWNTKDVFSLCLTFDFLNDYDNKFPEDYYTKLMDQLNLELKE